MNRFREHVGGAREPVTVEFATTAELLAIPCVAWWLARAPQPIRYLKTPHQGARSRDGLTWDGYLMVEYGDGKSGVLGYLHDVGAVDLPLWESGQGKSPTP